VIREARGRLSLELIALEENEWVSDRELGERASVENASGVLRRMHLEGICRMRRRLSLGVMHVEFAKAKEEGEHVEEEGAAKAVEEAPGAAHEGGEREEG